MDAVVIGLGNVGKATAGVLRQRFDVSGHDLERAKLNGLVAWPRGPVDLAVVCVPTPPSSDGRLSTAHVDAAVRDAAPHARVVAVRSTMPVGGMALVAEATGFRSLVYWPCFSRERMMPEDEAVETRVVLGVAPEGAGEHDAILDAIMACYPKRDTDGVVDWTAAELAKLWTNAFLATSIAFANEMAGLCRAHGVDPDAVAALLRRDPRIGERAYLDARGPFGGTCLPKDLAELIAASDSDLLREVQRWTEEGPAAKEASPIDVKRRA
jgi:UDPglucose 6-dehydrogenase